MMDRGTSTTDDARVTLKGALNPVAALRSNVARRKEGVEIILGCE